MARGWRARIRCRPARRGTGSIAGPDRRSWFGGGEVSTEKAANKFGEIQIGLLRNALLDGLPHLRRHGDRLADARGSRGFRELGFRVGNPCLLHVGLHFSITLRKRQEESEEKIKPFFRGCVLLRKKEDMCIIATNSKGNNITKSGAMPPELWGDVKARFTKMRLGFSEYVRSAGAGLEGARGDDA